MSATARLASNFVFFAIIFEVVGGVTTDSWNPLSFFGDASWAIRIVLGVLLFFLLYILLMMFGLMGLKKQGDLDEDTVCGYDECQWQNVPLLQGMFLGRRYRITKCYGPRHPADRRWFHAICWRKMTGSNPSAMAFKNVCRDCRERELEGALAQWVTTE